MKRSLLRAALAASVLLSCATAPVFAGTITTRSLVTASQLKNYQDDTIVMVEGSADYGGAIYNEAIMSIGNDALFSGNTAVDRGGAILNEVNGTITIGDNAQFKDNTASTGGALGNKAA
jgi:predicted outer membrane repeat protein